MNFLILLYLLFAAPKLLWDRISKGKRHPAFLQRIGIKIPRATGEVIWIHAVSVGEVKAAQPLFRALRKQKKGAFFLITTTSATGQAEARRSLPEADAFAYLPIDFTWVVRRWVKKLNPQMFFLVESDFWWNLLAALKKNRTRIFLVSGKMSARSARRFGWARSFSKKLFAHFDRICVQSEEHARRFSPFISDPSRLHVTGNLKFDIEPQPVALALPMPPQPAIAISCTHAPEEEWLLDALQSGPWFFFLIPRHPERFEEVAQLLKKKNIPFTRWSRLVPDHKNFQRNLHPDFSVQQSAEFDGNLHQVVENERKAGQEKMGQIPKNFCGKVLERFRKVLLVDAMGQVPICYAHSRLVIVAGSYVEHIGGHNILEPCLYGAPVFFGPHVYGQEELAKRVIASGAGRKVPLDQLKEAVEAFFANPAEEKAMKQGVEQLIQSCRGATLRTLDAVTTSSPRVLLEKKKK